MFGVVKKNRPHILKMYCNSWLFAITPIIAQIVYAYIQMHVYNTIHNLTH